MPCTTQHAHIDISKVFDRKCIENNMANGFVSVLTSGKAVFTVIVSFSFIIPSSMIFLGKYGYDSELLNSTELYASHNTNQAIQRE